MCLMKAVLLELVCFNLNVNVSIVIIVLLGILNAKLFPNVIVGEGPFLGKDYMHDVRVQDIL